MAEHGCYLYLVARDLPADRIAGVTGVSGNPVRCVPRDGLVAVVSAVDLTEFGEEGLRRNLEDLHWLEQVARAHDHVVQAVATSTDVAPVRLATVCLDDDSVRAKMRERRESIEQTLSRIHGRVEWGVKALLDIVDDVETSTVADESGTAYLKRRQAAARRRDDLADRSADTAGLIHDELADLAVASRRHAPQDQRLSKHRGQMILNCAYLVDHARSDAFQELVDRLDSCHPDVHLEVTGPWPPYSFADMDMP